MQFVVARIHGNSHCCVQCGAAGLPGPLAASARAAASGEAGAGGATVPGPDSASATPVVPWTNACDSSGVTGRGIDASGLGRRWLRFSGKVICISKMSMPRSFFTVGATRQT